MLSKKSRNSDASVSRETKAVQRRRQVILDALITDAHSPERLRAQEDIMKSYPKLRHIVTDQLRPPSSGGGTVDGSRHSSAVLPSGASAMTSGVMPESADIGTQPR